MCRERERVSYGITTKVEVTTTTIGVNRSPKRERIFLQKIKFQKVGFLREKFCWEVSKSEICSKKVESKQATSRNSKIRAKKAVWANCGSWSYVKAEKNPNLKFKSLVWWFRNPSVCSCVGYTENQIFDLLQDEFQKNLPIIIISQCVLCSIQNSKPGRVVVVNFKRFLNFFREIKSIYFTKNSMDFCEISMLLLLPSSFGNVQSRVFQYYGWKIQITRCWLPPVAAAY